MKKVVIRFFLIISFGISCWLLFKIHKNCPETGEMDKIQSYKWIDPKDEKSLVNKMGFQKKEISPSKEVHPGTVVNIINFSRKSNAELNINDREKRPFYYFSEKYITPPVYLYTIKNALFFFGEDTRKILVFKNGFYTLLGRENDSLERILPKLLEKQGVFYDEENSSICLIRELTAFQEIKHKTILFHGDWNLYHLLMEPSPGLLLIKALNYLTLAYFSQHNLDIIRALGNPAILQIKLFDFEKFSELTIPSTLLENNAHFPNIQIMSALIQSLKRKFSKKTTIEPLGKKVFVSRADASRRKILNELNLYDI